MRKLFVSFLYIFMLIGVKGHCTLELDYNGTRLIQMNRPRICDDSVARAVKNVYSISDICNFLDQPKSRSVRSLNLSNNMIADEGTQILGAYFKQPRFLPSLQELDLSFNRISENGIDNLSILLLRPNFKYLIIYGNAGAASLSGIKRLVQTIQYHLVQGEDVSPYLAKVIWVPQNWIDSAQSSGNLPQYYADIHRQFYGN